jgi:tRNA pseudouridine38-40 synthase
MMKNIKLTISYDGTNYHGWQRQNDVKTIQSSIEAAIYRLTGENVNMTASGRTDANVHAIGQVANFKTNSNIFPEKFFVALNSLLTEDIRILKSEEVDFDFNSRFNAKKKTYLYKIFNGKVSDPFNRMFSWHIPYELDCMLMDKALKELEGEYDFRAFMSSNSSVKSTIRTIYNTNISKENDIIIIEITSNGFLYNMVRIIVGTIVEIASNKRDFACIKQAIELGQRNLLGRTAQAQGLFLKEVIY